MPDGLLIEDVHLSSSLLLNYITFVLRVHLGTTYLTKTKNLFAESIVNKTKRKLK